MSRGKSFLLFVRGTARAKRLLLAQLDHGGEGVATSRECMRAHKEEWQTLRGMGWTQNGTRPRNVHGATRRSRKREAERKGETQNEMRSTECATERQCSECPRTYGHIEQTCNITPKIHPAGSQGPGEIGTGWTLPSRLLRRHRTECECPPLLSACRCCWFPFFWPPFPMWQVPFIVTKLRPVCIERVKNL